MLIKVFPNPHQVMGKFVLNVYHSKLKEHISHKLQHSKSNSEQYLNDLYTLYSQVRFFPRIYCIKHPLLINSAPDYEADQ